MLGRAGPISCFTADLLVTLGKVTLCLSCASVLPFAICLCYSLVGTNLLLGRTVGEDWNSSSNNGFILFLSLNELSSHLSTKGLRC